MVKGKTLLLVCCLKAMLGEKRKAKLILEDRLVPSILQ